MHAEHIQRPGRRHPRSPTTARIAPLPESQWTNEQQQLAMKYTRHGRVDNGLATLLHVPPVADAALAYTCYLSEESTLSSRHRKLLILRAAWLCGSHALWTTHAARANHEGFTAHDLRRVATGYESSDGEPFEATLLRLVDELYCNASVRDATWRVLREHYDVFQLLDAVETVNHFIAMSMVYNSLGVQADAGADLVLPDAAYRVDIPDPEPPLASARLEPLPGTGFAVTRTFLHHPALNQKRLLRLQFINGRSPLLPGHRELLILRIGWNCQSEYEWAQHVGQVGRAREHGLEPIHIAQGPQAPGWSPLEKTLLVATDELYRDTTISDRTWAELTDHFDVTLTIAAVFTASTYWALSASLNALGVQLEPGNERFPRLP